MEVSNFINILFSTTETLLLEKTSDREDGTTSIFPLIQVRTLLTLLNSEYRAMFDDINSSTKSPLAK